MATKQSERSSSTTDPFRMLERDHRKVERLLEQLGDDPDEPELSQLVSQLVSELQLHMSFEEEQIYPLVQQLDGEMAEEAETEHRLAREGLEKLTSLAGAPGFGAAVEMVKGGITHHVEEEEGEMFPKLRRELDGERASALAASLLEAKQAAGLEMDDMSGMEDASKEELMEMAKERGIEGRSSMTKAELLEALAGG
jgi:hemerythrin superfamily protein